MQCQEIVLKLFSGTCMQMITLQGLMETKTRYINYGLWLTNWMIGFSNKGTRELSIDENIILFKGRSTLKQYNPMKLIKRGCKLWAMADQTGYTLAFKVYQGKDELAETEFQGYGLGERVVLELARHKYILIIIFLRPYFLRDWQQKKHTPKNLTDGKKLDRDVGYFKWKDTKRVHLVSNFHGSEITIVKRKNRSGNSKNVGCPTVVADYNQHMGGVDHADRLRQLY
ncbi:hypothetical protein PR048_012401 [Dryococelus australis]|uniref:PiggyBac transposable element-derived protein domain-containing protein n=1 Tax=Dryococelus australis TaxID=614101 RepID=A0ABQ9HPP0_9NEOP|nr:hypothetical protein PR048_012401 [Dryococelus australis]